MYSTKQDEVTEAIPIDCFLCNSDMFCPNYGFIIPLAEPDTNNEQESLEQNTYGNQVAYDLEGSYLEPCMDSVINQSQWEVPNHPNLEEYTPLLEPSCSQFESEVVDSESSSIVHSVGDTSAYEGSTTREEELYRPTYSVEDDSYSSRIFESTVHIPPPATVVFAGSIYDTQKGRD